MKMALSVGPLGVRMSKDQYQLLLAVVSDNFGATPRMPLRPHAQHMSNIAYKYAAKHAPSTYLIKLVAPSVVLRLFLPDENHAASPVPAKLVTSLPKLVFDGNRPLAIFAMQGFHISSELFDDEVAKLDLQINSFTAWDARPQASTSCFQCFMAPAHEILAARGTQTVADFEQALSLSNAQSMNLAAFSSHPESTVSTLLNTTWITVGKENRQALSVTLNKPYVYVLPDFMADFLFFTSVSARKDDRISATAVAVLVEAAESKEDVVLSDATDHVFQLQLELRDPQLVLLENPAKLDCASVVTQASNVLLTSRHSHNSQARRSSEINFEFRGLHGFVCRADKQTSSFAHSLLSPLHTAVKWSDSFEYVDVARSSTVREIAVHMQPVELRASYEDLRILHAVTARALNVWQDTRKYYLTHESGDEFLEDDQPAAVLPPADDVHMDMFADRLVSDGEGFLSVPLVAEVEGAAAKAAGFEMVESLSYDDPLMQQYTLKPVNRSKPEILKSSPPPSRSANHPSSREASAATSRVPSLGVASMSSSIAENNAPSAIAANRTQEFVSIEWGGLSLVVINDVSGRYLPLINVKLGQARTDVKGNDGVFSVNVALELASNYFNSSLAVWEPLIEPTTVKLTLYQSDAESLRLEYGLKSLPTTIPYSLSVDCDSDLNINMTHSFLDMALSTLRIWHEDTHSSLDVAPFSPYYLRNDTGANLFYWTSVGQDHQIFEVSSGSEVQLHCMVYCVVHKSLQHVTLSFCQIPLNLEHLLDQKMSDLHTSDVDNLFKLNLQLAGPWGPIHNLSVSRVGNFMALLPHAAPQDDLGVQVDYFGAQQERAIPLPPPPAAMPQNALVLLKAHWAKCSDPSQYIDVLCGIEPFVQRGKDEDVLQLDHKLVKEVYRDPFPGLKKQLLVVFENEKGVMEVILQDNQKTKLVAKKIAPNAAGPLRTGSVSAATTATPMRLFVGVSLRDGSKLVTVRSPMLLENHTLLPLSFKLQSSTQPGSLELGPVLPGTSLPIPVTHSQWDKLFVQPQFAQEYHWSALPLSSNALAVSKAKNTNVVCEHTSGGHAFQCIVSAQMSLESDFQNGFDCACEQFVLRFHTPFVLRNLLPRRIQFQVRQGGKILDRGVVAPGNEAAIHVVHLTTKLSPAECVYKIDGFEWSPWIALPTYDLIQSALPLHPVGTSSASSVIVAPTVEQLLSRRPSTSPPAQARSPSQLQTRGAVVEEDVDPAKIARSLGIAPIDKLVQENQGSVLVSEGHVKVNDTAGQTLCVNYVTSCVPPSHSLKMDLFVEYWLVNKSDQDLVFGNWTKPELCSVIAGQAVPVEVDTYENQRYTMFTGWGKPFLPTDRHEWSDKTGRQQRKRDQIDLPNTEFEWRTSWYVDMRPPCDKDGWRYALDFTIPSKDWHATNQMTDCVRRRRWVRVCAPARLLRNYPLVMYGTLFKGDPTGWSGKLQHMISSPDQAAQLHYVRNHGTLGYGDEEEEFDDDDDEDSDNDVERLPAGPVGPAARVRRKRRVAVRTAVTLPISVRMSESPWSKQFAVDQAAFDGQLQLAQNVHQGPGGLESYEFAVHFAEGPLPFQRTKIVSFAPRFVVVNHLPFGIRIKQYNTSSSHSFSCGPEERTPFFWADAHESALVSIASVFFNLFYFVLFYFF
jgi:hypothetical protein